MLCTEHWENNKTTNPISKTDCVQLHTITLGIQTTVKVNVLVTDTDWAILIFSVWRAVFFHIITSFLCGTNAAKNHFKCANMVVKEIILLIGKVYAQIYLFQFQMAEILKEFSILCTSSKNAYLTKRFLTDVKYSTS